MLLYALKADGHINDIQSKMKELASYFNEWELDFLFEIICHLTKIDLLKHYVNTLKVRSVLFAHHVMDVLIALTVSYVCVVKDAQIVTNVAIKPISVLWSEMFNTVKDSIYKNVNDF